MTGLPQHEASNPGVATAAMSSSKANSSNTTTTITFADTVGKALETTSHLPNKTTTNGPIKMGTSQGTTVDSKFYDLEARKNQLLYLSHEILIQETLHFFRPFRFMMDLNSF